jgi:hypothetical protein
MSDEATIENLEPIPKHIQDFIFVRELSEVYLLIDHVSGRWDKSLTDGDLVRAVCEIGWPPTGTDVEQAAQAAALLSAKDKLNNIARPASGATIAFTLLVSGEDNVDHNRGKGGLSSLWHSLINRFDGSTEPPLSGPTGVHHWSGDPPSRLSLARLAYPGLVAPAKWFKWAIRIIIVLLLLWLMATCLLSWDIAAGHAIFVRVETLRAQESDYFAQIKILEADAAKRAATAGAPATPAAHATDIGLLLLKNCGWRRELTPGSKTDYTAAGFDTIDEITLCNQLARVHLDYAVSRQNLAGWLADWRHWLGGFAGWLCRHQCLPVPNSSNAVPEEETNEQWGAILLQVLASAVLPLCYGFLGAGAAVVRDLWGKMKDSLLSPRDLTLALGQLALGAVIGACIGLFVSPSGTTPQAPGGLLGSVVLSASALSFIAGFGVEGVFVALESLIKRVFNIPQTPRPGSPARNPQ